MRRGRYSHVPRVSHQAPSAVQTIRYESFAIRGPILFNSLPSKLLRNMTITVQLNIDTVLETIPEPHTPGFTYMIREESNSLIHTELHLPLPDIPQARGGHQ